MIIKSFGKAVGSFLFTTFLSISLLMIGLVDFTSYSKLKNFATDFLSAGLAQQIDTNSLNQIYSNLKQKCVNKESTNLELGAISIKISCADVGKTQTKDLITLISSNLFDSLYYRKYSCGFLECLQQTGNDKLLVLLSEHANNFLKSTQIFIWILTAIGVAIMYFSIDTLQGRLMGFGTSLAFTGAYYLVSTYAINFLIGSQLLSGFQQLSELSDNLFGNTAYYFIITFIVGILLIITGYLLKLRRRAK